MKVQSITTFEEGVAFLESATPLGSQYGLTGIQNLLTELENPHAACLCVHIAGTNGKGSVLSFLGAILEDAGYKTGYYLTPSLSDITGSIAIDKTPMEKNAFVTHINTVREAVFRMIDKGLAHPTRFEMETALAFLYFKAKHCDIVLLETGLGGTLDATNIVETPLLSIICAIGMDHMDILGASLKEIAAHKAGIIKNHSQTVALKQSPEITDILLAACARQNNKIRLADPDNISVIAKNIFCQTFSYEDAEGIPWKNISLSMAAPYQRINAAIAIESAAALSEMGYIISQENIKSGLKRARHPGRFMPVMENPLLVLDGAHNEAGAKALATAIHTLLADKPYLILGIFKDKEYEKIIDILAPVAKGVVLFHMPENKRLLPPEILLEALSPHPCKTYIASSVEAAVKKALALAGNEGVAVACGSLSFLGRILDYVDQQEGSVHYNG